jgi:hypothetical protein
MLIKALPDHHAAQLRPHAGAPLPELVSPPPSADSRPCPGELFEHIHPASAMRQASTPAHYQAYAHEHLADTKTSPFFTISQQANGQSVANDVDEARATIRRLQRFDADPRVLLIAAHDASLAPILSYLPETANGWYQQGWKERGRWLFLHDLWPAVSTR